MPPLQQGAVVGNRFVIDERVAVDVHGTLYRAVDEKTGKTIAILMMDPAVVGERAITDKVRASVKTATEIRHKNLLGVFGMGKEGQHRYVARDFVDGQTLADLLDKKASAGKQFTLKGAYNLIAHVCNALQYGRAQMAHGTLRPSVVLINRLGRVKLADFGFAELRPAFVQNRARLNRWDQPCFADAEGAVFDDLHGLGIILYELLVGAPPSDDAAADARTRLPETLVPVVTRCLIGAPDRFGDPNDLKAELARAIENTAANARSGVSPPPTPDGQDAEDDGADEEVPGDDGDGEEPEARPAAPSAEAAPSAAADAGRPPAPAATGGIGKAGADKSRARKDKGKGKSKDGGKGKGGFVIPDLGPAGGGEDDGTTQRWLMERDGIDYGPFTGKQIVEKLFKEEIDASTVVFDIETDRRLPLNEIDLFEETLLAWVHEKDKRQKQRAEEAEAAAARRRTRIVLGTILFLLVTVGGGFGGWFFYQSTLPTPSKANLAGMVAVMKTGLPSVSLPEELPETAAEIRERRDKERKERLARASAAERARILREEKLAASSSLNAEGGGTGKFDRAAFDKVVAGRQGQMVRCLQNEVRRNPKLKSLTVEITVIPNGQLINVKMPGASGRGQGCVRKALRGLTVPGFAGTNVKVKLPFQFQ